jgi:hypothetical protein
LSGGEPFLQKETWDLVSWLDDNPNENLELSVFSNLQIDHSSFSKGLEKLISLSKKLKAVQLVCSLDTWGEASEYILYGHSLQSFESNFKQALNFESPIELTLHSTLTALSAFSLSALTEKVYQWLQSRQFDWQFERCLSPAHFDPCILPKETLKELTSQLSNEYQKLFNRREDQLKLSRILKGIVNDPPSPRLVFELIDVLETLDSRRNTNWRDHFSELASI